MSEHRTPIRPTADSSVSTLSRTAAIATDSTLAGLEVDHPPTVAESAGDSVWRQPRSHADLPSSSTDAPASIPAKRVLGLASIWHTMRHFGPSWLTSAIVHALILVALGFMVIAAEPGKQIDGLLATFAQGDRPDAAELATVEMDLPLGDPHAESSIGSGGRGSGSGSGIGPDVGGVLGGGEISQVRVETSDTGPWASGSAASDINAAIGNGQIHDDIVRPRPGGGGGDEEVVGKGYASFFGLKAKGYRFIYVVDGSGSMAGRRFAAARDQLVSSLTALDEHQSFYVIFFNVTEYPQFFPLPEKNLSPVSPSTLRKVGEWMSGFVPNGDTNPGQALSRALAMAPDAIFLLTDGEFHPAVVETIRRENYRRTPIHTIAFESILGQDQLFGIAQMTGGTYRFVP